MDKKQIKKFTFTWNNYTNESITFLERYYNAYCQYMIYGEEVAPTTGTKHLQGYIELKKYRRFKQIVEKDFEGKIHIEIARGNYAQNQVYCSKTGNYKEFGQPNIQGSNKCKKDNIRELISKCSSYKEVLEIEGIERYLKFAQEYYNMLDKRRPDIYKDCELKDWQELIVNYLDKEGDNRTILFVIDRKGGRGKTWLCGYLYNVRDDIFYTTNGKTQDILYNYSKSLKHNILIDITRSITLDKVNYDAIESLCNPIMTSNKYNSMTMFRDKKANIILFTNDGEYRDFIMLSSKLSSDRIKILDLDNNKLQIQDYYDYVN